MPKQFKDQDYSKIKKYCLERRLMFTDPEFPPNIKSLWYSDPRLPDIEWRRVGQLCHDPKFVVGGNGGGVPNETNIIQGSLGDCWMIAALTAMTRHGRLWKSVIPKSGEQEWDERRPGAYRGVFHFRFWHFGKWYDIVVDDYLPTRNERLIFARSRNDNEFWSALFEKAYAKFHGCYERLVSGSLAEALVDITGGVPENINIANQTYKTPEQRKLLLKILRKALDWKALILAAVHAKNESEMEKETTSGLLKGHAYSVNAVRTLTMDGTSKVNGLRDFFKKVFKEKNRVDLVRLRNPWGRKEWTGAWSDGSMEWRRVGSLQRRKIAAIFQEANGEFWMAFDDFVDNFACITICHLHFRSTYKEHAFSGRWSNGNGDRQTLRAGGSVNDKETFLCNPQYLLKVEKSCRLVSNKTDVIISLLQSHSAVYDREAVRRRTAFLSIGVTVIRVEENRKYRLHELRGLEPVAMNDFVNCRSNFLRLSNLSVGHYVLVPSTFRAREEGDYYLRVFCNSSTTSISYLNRDAPNIFKTPDWCCFNWTKPFAVVTRVKILYGKELASSHLNGYFVALITEKRRYRSRVIRNTTEPHWNWSQLIYRRSHASPLILQLWAVGNFCCGFTERALMGEIEIETLTDDKFWQYTMTILDSRKRPVGEIALNVTSSNDCVFGL